MNYSKALGLFHLLTWLNLSDSLEKKGGPMTLGGLSQMRA